MKPHIPILFAFAFALAGCDSISDSVSPSAAQRTAISGGAGAAAGLAAYTLSDKDPAITAGAALGGAVLADALQGDDAEYGRRMIAQGVKVGRAIEAKKFYWAMENLSTQGGGAQQQLYYYKIWIPPGEKINGQKHDGHFIYVPIHDAAGVTANGSVANPSLGQMVDGRTDVIAPRPGIEPPAVSHPTVAPYGR